MNMGKTFLNIYNKDRAIPLIKNILKKEGYDISDDIIKVWNRPTMMIGDVIIGCNYVKRVGSDIVVYTNSVPNKEYIESNEKVKIFDNEDLLKLSLKYHQHDLFDMLSCGV
jgi:hypothetical protein